MQQIILTCDLCAAAQRAKGERREKPSYAVATLDVCQAHHRQYGPRPRKKTGRPPKPVETTLSALERKRAADRERKRKQAAERGAWPKRKPQATRSDKGIVRLADTFAERQAIVLSLIPTVGSVSSRDLWKRAIESGKLSKGTYHKTMTQLRKRGLVTMKGGRSQALYTKATPERATA